MIISGIIYILYGLVFVVTLPLRLFADATLPAFLTAAVSNISPYISILDAVLPLGTIISIVGFYVVVEVAIFTYKGIMWIIKRFPTQS
jgi:hypothetical protein